MEAKLLETLETENTEKTEEKENTDIDAFYGLLTFELKYTNDNVMDNETKKALKHSYTKIIVEKLKEKYDSIEYAISDKVFFSCNNVSLFNLLVRDIIQLNKVISEISMKKEIKTALKVCFWAKPNINPKEACAILVRINKLNYLNKIIVSEYIQLKFNNQLIKCFDFCPLGTIKLEKLKPDDEDVTTELFYLKTLDG